MCWTIAILGEKFILSNFKDNVKNFVHLKGLDNLNTTGTVTHTFIGLSRCLAGFHFIFIAAFCAASSKPGQISDTFPPSFLAL